MTVSDDTARTARSAAPGTLDGIRVLEIGDHQGEYCALVLAGLGADVIKIEPPGGAASRTFPPFADDEPGTDRSLYFWAYNRGKRSIVLDLDDEADVATTRRLIAEADVIIDSTSHGYLDERGLGQETSRASNPGLVFGRLSPFGDVGPRRDWKASDVVHLALGGVVMNCGYDPDPSGHYDLPPIAPQSGHSYAIAGEQLAMTVIAALVYRHRSGAGQYLSCAIHEAVAKNTEGDLMSWVALRTPFHRQTCRHSAPTVSRYRTIVPTKDARWFMTTTRDSALLAPFLEKYGIGGNVRDTDGEEDAGSRVLPGMEKGAGSNMDAIEHTIRRYLYDDVPWHEAQAAGLMWVPMRKPHENIDDPHWIARRTYSEVEHPELGRSVTYPTSKWLATGSNWVPGRRAPLLDEDRADILSSGATTRPRGPEPTRLLERMSVHNKPSALSGVTILDFTWMLASAGATRFLASLGADVIKVEWHKNLDPRRGGAPVGGRAAREMATGPVESRWPADLGGPVGAQYNNKNPGKRGISLNVKHPEGLALAKRLVQQCNVVTEGFSPGVMEGWGLGYDELRAINPNVIYAKQSGMGSQGVYGRFRTIGPVAAAFSGVSDMSGLAEPMPPAGWGYSYLDWYGAYSFALAVVTAVLHRERTGEGQWIDASQCEVGLYLTGVPALDWSVNRRPWQRDGNRSPHLLAGPEGIYRCAGEDAWIAITCSTEAEWARLVETARRPDLLDRPEFGTLAGRREHGRLLDKEIESWTSGQDAFALMEALQTAGVPAGVAQTAADRYDRDPQLRALDWLTELEATNFGRWPVAAPSVKMSETPQHAGGIVNRAAPAYGEHNYEVYGSLLGMSEEEVDALRADGIL
ncbi:CoA transferase [Jatrophihabitans sp.]|uniref:CaiB/BaiF CoA-transferase family protein n=1 Tax=Jatrophihabitans sp. TaxID=1932789 RepID=UPI0030C76BDD|nr:hypothetical protein [Jatrophihabitans sp.]